MDRRILRELLKREETTAAGLQSYIESVTDGQDTLEEALKLKSKEMFFDDFDRYLETKMKIDIIKRMIHKSPNNTFDI